MTFYKWHCWICGADVFLNTDYKESPCCPNCGTSDNHVKFIETKTYIEAEEK